MVTANIPQNKIFTRNIAGALNSLTITDQENWLMAKIMNGIDRCW